MQAKGLNAEILPKKGNFYMVSLGSFDTSEEAASVRQQLQVKAGIELWVMKNK
jgi:cell division protein FtsN